MTVKSLSVSQSTTPLMALADAALSSGDCNCSQKKTQKTSVSASSSSSSPMDRLTFAQQIMKLLDDDSSPYLKWMPDGKSFTIKNSKKFTSDEMPRLFNIRNMSSFVRKLTRWGFSRHHEKETMNFDIFKHTDFEKGQWDRCALIKCAAPAQPAVSASAIRNMNKMTGVKRPMTKSPAATRPVSPVSSSPSSTASSPTTSPVQTRPSPQSNGHHQWKVLVHPSLRTPIMPSHSNMTSSNNGAAAAALNSIDELKLDHAARTNLLALQLLQEASQQQLHYDHALLQYWLARQSLPTSAATINHAQYAAMRGKY